MTTQQNNTLRDTAVNFLLDKISDKKGLTRQERQFLSMYQSLSDSEFKDYRLVTNTDAVAAVSRMLELGIDVTCNLRDRCGAIGANVSGARMEGPRAMLVLSGHTEIEIGANHLYDLYFSTQVFGYSLESDHEFYELAPIK
jgi:hypothetical protein